MKVRVGHYKDPRLAQQARSEPHVLLQRHHSAQQSCWLQLQLQLQGQITEQQSHNEAAAGQCDHSAPSIKHPLDAVGVANTRSVRLPRESRSKPQLSAPQPCCWTRDSESPRPRRRARQKQRQQRHQRGCPPPHAGCHCEALVQCMRYCMTRPAGCRIDFFRRRPNIPTPMVEAEAFDVLTTVFQQHHRKRQFSHRWFPPGDFLAARI